MPPDPGPARAITISASYGAGGSEVGPLLADRLGLVFLDRAIPREVSDRLSVPLAEALAREEPAPSGTIGRILAQLAPAALAVYGGPVVPEILGDEQSFRRETEKVLRRHAATGAIILGRGAAVVLRGLPHATHVRLDGPREGRLRQAMRLEQIDRRQAESRMHSADLSRETYLRHWYRTDPHDPGLYHLVIDSTAIPLEGCVELIARVSELRGASFL